MKELTSQRWAKQPEGYLELALLRQDINGAIAEIPENYYHKKQTPSPKTNLYARIQSYEKNEEYLELLNPFNFPLNDKNKRTIEIRVYQNTLIITNTIR